MTDKKWTIAFILMTVLSTVLLCLLCFQSCQPEPEPTIVTKTDTLVVHSTDTIFVEKPKFISRTILDTVYITKDTIVYRESRTYEDSLSTIWISGVNPELDSIRYYIPRDTVIVSNETTITKTEIKRMGWGITLGLYGGYGGYYNPQNGTVGLSPEIGLGVAIGWSFLFK